MTTDHLPECRYQKVIELYGNNLEPDGCEIEDRCICHQLRACEQRISEEWFHEMRKHGRFAKGYAAGLDAAREAVERVSTLFEPLGPALAAIDELRNPPSLPPTTGRAHKY